MKLNVETRVAAKKNDARRLRREGKIPAILYQKGKESETLSVNDTEFAAHLREIVPGHLPTTVFKLSGSKHKEITALVKEIQYNPVNYNVIHLDFEELKKGELLRVKVPVVVVGELDSIGIKQGGIVRLVIRHILVECAPEHIPTSFIVDVKGMQINESCRVKDLQIPETVRAITAANEIAVSMVKK